MNTPRVFSNALKALICVALFLGIFFLVLGQQKRSRISDTIVQIEYGMPVPAHSYGQLFWSDEKDHFQEKQSTRFRLVSGQAYYGVKIPALSCLESIRLDPINSDQPVLIKSIKIKERNSASQQFNSPELPVELLQPINSSIELSPDNSGVYFKPLSEDPQLHIDVDDLEKEPLLTWTAFALSLLIFSGVLAGAYLLRRILQYRASFRYSSGGRTSSRFLTGVEIFCSCIIVVVAVLYLGEWIGEMSSSSLWTDEIYTIENFSSKGLKVALTDYHAANNHILFNTINSLLPDADSYEPMRARLISFIAVLACVLLTLWFYFRRHWYFAGALVVVALTNSWPHLVLMLEARGYGLAVFSSLLLVYSSYSYLSKPATAPLIGVVCGAVMGTMSIPTFGFFGLPLLGLVFIIKPNRQTLSAVALGFGIIAAVYTPLLPEMMRINAGYSDKWGAEYGSINAVIMTLQNYLLPDANTAIIVVILSSVLAIALFPWQRFPRTSYITSWRPAAISVVLFFLICVFLRTPAARTTAFISLPIAAILVAVFSFRVKKLWLRGVCGVFFAALCILLFQDYSGKRATLEVYYQPNENWKASAELIQHIFPPDRISVYNSSRSGLLKKYLPDAYEVVDDYSADLYESGEQVLIDSTFRDKNRLDSVDNLIGEGELFRIPQVRAEYQLVLYRVPISAKNYTIVLPEDEACGPLNDEVIIEDLNRCANYIGNQTVEIMFEKPTKVHSLNLSGTGLSADRVMSIKGMSGDELINIPRSSTKVFFEEGRKWKRNPKSPNSLLSISLKSEKVYKQLQLTLAPLDLDGKTRSITSMWYR